MTAQIPDRMYFKGDIYSVVASTDRVVFDLQPLLEPLQPRMLSTGCYRGYFAEFGLDDFDRLVIRHLMVHSPNVCAQLNEVPPYCVFEPERGENGRSRTLSFDKVDLGVKVDGTVRCCRGFISSMYFHGGFQHFTSFEHVVDLVFQEGTLIEAKDLSSKTARLREILENAAEKKDKTLDSVFAWNFTRSTEHPAFVDFQEQHGEF